VFKALVVIAGLERLVNLLSLGTNVPIDRLSRVAGPEMDDVVRAPDVSEPICIVPVLPIVAEETVPRVALDAATVVDETFPVELIPDEFALTLLPPFPSWTESDPDTVITGLDKVEKNAFPEHRRGVASIFPLVTV